MDSPEHVSKTTQGIKWILSFLNIFINPRTNQSSYLLAKNDFQISSAIQPTTVQQNPRMNTLPLETLQEILDWLPLEDQPTSRLTCKLFAEMIPRTPEFQRHLGLTNNDPALVASALSRRPEFARNICHKSAKHGSLKVLQWARANGCPWDERTCISAAEGGHLHILQWARANDCSWDRWVCAFAAENGHLEVLQYAHRNGCPWYYWTYAHAAQNGHLEVLKWIRAKNYPWNSQECLNLSKNYPRVQEWILQNI